VETTFRSAAAALLAIQLTACGGAPFALDSTAATQIPTPNPTDAGSSSEASALPPPDANAIDAAFDSEASTAESDAAQDAGPPDRYLRDGAACYQIPTGTAKCGSDEAQTPTDYCAAGTPIPDGVPTQCQCDDTYNCACVVAAYAAVGDLFGCACSQETDGLITFGCK
jgi:hypothetical protein